MYMTTRFCAGWFLFRAASPWGGEAVSGPDR